MRVKIQLIAACILLVILGYFYGRQNSVVHTQACAPSDVSSATLIKTSATTPTTSRYVFMEDDGCTLLVYAPRFPVLVQGTVAEIMGKQEKTEDAFFDIPSFADFLLRDGISLVIRNPEVKIIKHGSAPLDVFRIQVASRIGLLFREPNASLVHAMITGDQGMISQDIKDIYRRSGITHILSVSGLHVSVIALCITFVVGLLRVPAYIRSLIIFSILWTYIVGVGSPASAVRAGVFWTCYVLAYHIRALTGVLTVILLTLAALLTHSPMLVKSVGFELSVMAVCGIGIALFFLRRLNMPTWLKTIATLFAVSLGATLTTAPLTLYYFGNISFVGLITNALVVPLLPIITYLVLAALFFQPILTPLALVFAFLADVLMKGVIFIAAICASIPYGNFEQLSFPLWGVVLFYCSLTMCIIFLMRYFKISWREWWI